MAGTDPAGAAAGEAVRADASTPPILISATELSRALRTPGLVVLDATVLLAPPRFDGDYSVRTGAERFAAGHIPGARHADLLEDLSDAGSPTHFAHLDADRLGAALARLGVEPGTRVVAYDSEGGFWSARLWWVLRTAGIAAQVLDGGFAAWLGAGLAVAAGWPEPWQAAQPWQPDVDPHAWIDKPAVEAIVLGHRQGQLVCALGADSFEGRVPTRYARRGHIPGSLSMPAHALFGSDQRYLDPARIRASYAELLRSPVRPIVLYCGGGISAAASALALALAGESSIAIYDGSLEEWAADPGLPLEARRSATGGA
jgi:thiosulfate/3-mercaptopyruvate sulfurtransferase